MVKCSLGSLSQWHAFEGGAGRPEWSYVYDANDNLISQTDPRLAVTSYQYDMLNRVTRMDEPDPDGMGPLSSPVWRGGQTHGTAWCAGARGMTRTSSGACSKGSSLGWGFTQLGRSQRVVIAPGGSRCSPENGNGNHRLALTVPRHLVEVTRSNRHRRREPAAARVQIRSDVRWWTYAGGRWSSHRHWKSVGSKEELAGWAFFNADRVNQELAGITTSPAYRAMTEAPKRADCDPFLWHRPFDQMTPDQLEMMRRLAAEKAGIANDQNAQTMRLVIERDALTGFIQENGLKKPLCTKSPCAARSSRCW